jgi:hypothetical protein
MIVEGEPEDVGKEVVVTHLNMCDILEILWQTLRTVGIQSGA